MIQILEYNRVGEGPEVYELPPETDGLPEDGSDSDRVAPAHLTKEPLAIDLEKILALWAIKN